MLAAALAALLCGGGIPTWSAVPAPDTIKAGVRIRLRDPKANDELIKLGYHDKDLITRINGLPIRSLYEVTNLIWAPTQRTNARLTVISGATSESVLGVPASWRGVDLSQEEISWRRYVEQYRDAQGDAWDELVKPGLEAYDQQNLAATRQALAKAVAAGAHDGLTCCALGWSYQGKIDDANAADWAQSRKYLDMAVDYFKKDPSKDYVTQALTHFYLAYCVKREDSEGLHIKQLEEANKLDSKNPTIVETLALDYQEFGKYEASVRVVDEYLSLYPDRHAFWQIKIEDLRKMYMVGKLLAEMNKRISQYPDLLDLRRQYIKELREQKESKECMKQIDAVFTSFEKSLMPWEKTKLREEFIAMAIEANKPSRAVSYAEDIAKERGQTMDYGRLGQVYALAGDWSKSALAFQKFEELAAKEEPKIGRWQHQLVESEIGKMVLHLNGTELAQYGFTQQAIQMKRVKDNQRSTYVFLHNNGSLIVKILLGIAGGLALIYVIYKFGVRRREY
ncbi:MAG: hypothetical protein NTX50_08640 [Candidatus Sumerlaeota bacterium]|nr:hypothetical protein [Candidatus Sumerlaeota bacterium]